MGISSEFKYVAACSLSAAVGVALIGIPAPASADQINGLAAVSAATRVEPQNRPGALGDPATWTDKQLAAQLLLVGATSSQLKKVKSAVREGIGQTKTPEQTRALAFKFGKRMKQIGIGTDLAPVADLAYAGSWTDTDGRAFKSNPKRNGVYVTAFAAGLKDAGVMATVKRSKLHSLQALVESW